MLWHRLLLRTYSIVFIGRTKYSWSLEIGSYALQELILSLEGAVLCWDQELCRFNSFGSDSLHRLMASLNLAILFRTNHLRPRLRWGQKAMGKNSGLRGHLREHGP
jgi:hypothetical protein